MKSIQAIIEGQPYVEEMAGHTYYSVYRDETRYYGTKTVLVEPPRMSGVSGPGGAQWLLVGVWGPYRSAKQALATAKADRVEDHQIPVVLEPQMLPTGD